MTLASGACSANVVGERPADASDEDIPQAERAMIIAELVEQGVPDAAEALTEVSEGLGEDTGADAGGAEEPVTTVLRSPEARLDAGALIEFLMGEVRAERAEDLPGELQERGVGVSVPPRPDEFLCRSCFLIRRRSQLADPTGLRCRDCIAAGR